jgi:hypothetical protein
MEPTFNFVYIFIFPHSFYMSCPPYTSSATPSILGPNILLSTLFSNYFSLRSYICGRNQVSYPFNTTGNIIILYFQYYVFR